MYFHKVLEGVKTPNVSSSLVEQFTYKTFT